MKLVRTNNVGWWTAEGARANGAVLAKKLTETISGPVVLLTLTVQPSKHGDPYTAYQWGVKTLRNVMCDLRAVVPVPRYLWKLEVQKNEFPHWHLIIPARWSRAQKRLAIAAILRRWRAGSGEAGQGVDVRICRDAGAVGYLCKYVCKSPEWPDWMQDRIRIRIVQTSRGFFGGPVGGPVGGPAGGPVGEKKKRDLPVLTYRERIETAYRLVKLVSSHGWFWRGRLSSCWFDWYKSVRDAIVTLREVDLSRLCASHPLIREVGRVFALPSAVVRDLVPVGAEVSGG